MNKCEHCGHLNEAFFKFCLACGADLSSGPTKPSSGSPGFDIQVPKTTGLDREPAEFSQDTVEVPTLTEEKLAAVTLAPMVEPEEEQPDDEEVITGKAEPEQAPKPELTWVPLDVSKKQVEEKTEPARDTTPMERPAADWMAPTDAHDKEMLAERPDVLRMGAVQRPGSHATTEDAIEPTRITASPIRQATNQPAPEVAPPSARTTNRRCPGCGALSPGAHAFCGQCGFRFEEEAPAAAPVKTGRRVRSAVKLVVINEDGTDGQSFSLYEGDNVLGRGGGELAFSEDVYLDPHHADLQVEGDMVTVTDRDSVNGTFIRITEPALIEHSDTFRLGQELMRFEEIEQAEQVIRLPDDDTQLLGAPVPEGVWGRLVQIMNPDLVGNAYMLAGRFVTIGRERGDITFPGDGYVSGRHATLTRRNGSLYLEDLDSSNGTYVRIKGSAAVFDGDLLLLGQQLFRISF